MFTKVFAAIMPTWQPAALPKPVCSARISGRIWTVGGTINRAALRLCLMELESGDTLTV